MNKIKHGNISTVKISNNVWVARTETFEIMKAEIEMKGFSEVNAYQKLITFINSDRTPKEVQTLENGNKIYHF